eukprot:TRINITY_DN3568_c0_g2_i1.p1 TRINITY_DN3568_c0_g2~~TRINITY_DN3568_c0_g2_i1.p1  ORF type:complete len:127 (-),score=47.68 TRINITY_DN3568_c0_g2_i1:141-521(-)
MAARQPAPPTTPVAGEDRYILSRDALRDLVSTVDPSQELDLESENLLMMMADEFVDNVTQFSAKLAKHRGSDVLEEKDVELHLDHAYNIKIPGISDAAFNKPAVPAFNNNTAHQQHMDLVQKNKKL